MKHRCPTCNQPVSSALFDRITKIDVAKQRRLDHERKSLSAEGRRLAQERAIVAREREAVRGAVRAANEKRRAERIVAQGRERDLNAQLHGLQRTLEERRASEQRRIVAEVRDAIERVAAGPQRQGLAQERVLAEMLREAMPDDGYETPSRRGDVIQTVHVGKACAGKIVYESKRKARITSEDIRDALKAQRKTRADFAVLVHTGTCRGFGGLKFEENGVITTTPTGAVAMARILRAALVERKRMADELDRRVTDVEIRGLVAYLRGHEFAGLLRQLILETEAERVQVESEQTTTRKWWDSRTRRADTLRSLAESVGTSIALRMSGGKTNVIAAATRFGTARAEADATKRMTPAQSRLLAEIAGQTNTHRPMLKVLRGMREAGIVTFDDGAPLDRSRWRLTRLGEGVARRHGVAISKSHAAEG